MKKLKILIFVIMLSCIIPHLSQAGSVELRTYYPAPQGAYDRVVLMPQANLPTPCIIGSIIVEQSSGKLLYCHDISGIGTWGPLSNVWAQSATYIYPQLTDINPLIQAGIGTSTPGYNFKLTLENDGGILATGTFGSGIVTTYPIIAFNPSDPPPPANARLLWYPRKAAFRAIWDRWGITDDTQMGNYSTSFGEFPIADGIAVTTSGLFNSVSNDYSTIAGGKDNDSTEVYATITGGTTNIAQKYSVTSGSNNQANGEYNTVGGGQYNVSSGNNETISGGNSNTIAVNSTYSTISGGVRNLINGMIYGVISGGYQNWVGDPYGLASNYSTICGGYANSTQGHYTFVGGGMMNNTFGDFSVVGGGYDNNASTSWATIAGGFGNATTQNYATLLGGAASRVSGFSSIVTGGFQNTANGDFSVIAGGEYNTVGGDYSWAGGRYMNLTSSAHRTFVWGYSDSAVNITAQDAFILAPGTNSSGTPTYHPKLGINETNPSGILSITLPAASIKDFLTITSTSAASAGNIFIVKNNGYVGINKYNPSYPLHFGAQANNAYLTVGGVWTTPSSRELKENIQPLNEQQAIETLRKLKPVTYNYKIDPNEHHVGFIAEDVPEMIAEQDRNSVNPMNIAAILTAVLKEQDKEITQQDELLTTLENNVEDLKAGLNSH